MSRVPLYIVRLGGTRVHFSYERKPCRHGVPRNVLWLDQLRVHERVRAGGVE